MRFPLTCCFSFHSYANNSMYKTTTNTNPALLAYGLIHLANIFSFSLTSPPILYNSRFQKESIRSNSTPIISLQYKSLQHSAGMHANRHNFPHMSHLSQHCLCDSCAQSYLSILLSPTSCTLHRCLLSFVFSTRSTTSACNPPLTRTRSSQHVDVVFVSLQPRVTTRTIFSFTLY